jgi:V8-like Glu-specific endopeptidase
MRVLPHPLAPNLGPALLCSLMLLAGCGGGGNEATEREELLQPAPTTFPTSEDNLLAQAERKFDQALSAATVSVTPAPTCAGECETQDPPSNGGAVVGKDLVLAINDTTGADGVGILHQQAVPDDASMPPQTPPQIPDYEQILGTAGLPSVERVDPHKVTSGGVPVSPGTFARTQRVKVQSVYASEPNTLHNCSGTLVDSQWVVTAGHCVFKTGSKEYAKSVAVMPGFGNPEFTLEPWGRAKSTQILVREQYWESGDKNFDLAWVRLARPIGGFTGYHRMERFACNDFLNTVFTGDGYPARDVQGYPPFPVFDGKRMYELKFKFDSCKTGTNNIIRVKEMKYFGGQSGSGAVLSSGGGYGGVLAAVQSESSEPDVAPTASVTKFIRISNGALNNIAASINASTPSQPDIAPAHVNLSVPNFLPGAIPTLAAGSKVYFIPFFHNLSNAGFKGDLSYSIYLSINDVITTSDKFVAAYKLKNFAIAGKETRADAPQITIPCRPKNASSSTIFYLGVLVATSDANTGNNSTDQFSARLRISGQQCST